LKLHEAQPFDVIHSHFLLPDGLAGVYLGRKLKLPTVCSIHGSDALLHPHENLLNKYGARTVITQTKQIVVVSQALKTAVENFAKPSNIISVIYYGVDLEKFQEVQENADRSQLKAVSNKPYILFVGKQIYIKGLKDLLIAFEYLIDDINCNLVVVGPTLNEVQKLAPQLTQLLKDRLIVTGPLAPHEIPTFMQNCELFVLPSYSEGLPNVILEAMACGKPVIATKIVGIPEQVIHGQTGLLIEPGDPQSLAQAIQSLLSDPQFRRQMGQCGRERVIQKFTWERNASEMVSIYQEMISSWWR
jgi:glycosyltransferase involved in cell wall biosynthesis